MEDINDTEKKKKTVEETSENSATNQKKIYGDDINKIGNINEQNKNRIQVSNTKKSLFFYLNLAKVRIYKLLNFPIFSTIVVYIGPTGSILSCYLQRYMKQYDDLELSAMGMGMFLNIWFILQFWVLAVLFLSKMQR